MVVRRASVHRTDIPRKRGIKTFSSDVRSDVSGVIQTYPEMSSRTTPDFLRTYYGHIDVFIACTSRQTESAWSLLSEVALTSYQSIRVN